LSCELKNPEPITHNPAFSSVFDRRIVSVTSELVESEGLLSSIQELNGLVSESDTDTH